MKGSRRRVYDDLPLLLPTLHEYNLYIDHDRQLIGRITIGVGLAAYSCTI